MSKSMKLSALLVLCLAAALAEARNDLVIGVRQPNDFLIQRELVQKDADVSALGIRTSYERTFTGNNISNITMIRALDQHDNGHGATAQIVGGGVGFKYVTIKFKSELFRGIDFVVEIYGK
ncbi:hypothetical protein TKK_0003282 [Trichogramma kaykai]